MTKTFEEELNKLIKDGIVPSGTAEEYMERRNDFIKKYAPQPLPEVPEFVAEYIEECKKNKYALNLALDLMAKEYTSRKTELSTWIMSNQEQFAKAYFDKYTVQKPKRFYLKHIDMSRTDKECDWYLCTGCVKLGHEWVGKNLKPKDDDFKFTQEEINSMQTGSYEKVEVEE